MLMILLQFEFFGVALDVHCGLSILVGVYSRKSLVHLPTQHSIRQLHQQQQHILVK
jgi:hypothetical protein